MNDSNYLGRRLKKRRTEMGFTLQELASKTNLTASFISQIERGVTNPSLATLQKFADALSVEVMYFMAEDFSSGRRLTRSTERPRVMIDEVNITYELLTPDLSGIFEGIIIHLKPGSKNAVRRLRVETEELFFVLEGELLVGVGDEEIILKKGDSFHVMGASVKKLVCAGGHPVTYLAIISPPVL